MPVRAIRAFQVLMVDMVVGHVLRVEAFGLVRDCSEEVGVKSAFGAKTSHSTWVVEICRIVSRSPIQLSHRDLSEERVQTSS